MCMALGDISILACSISQNYFQMRIYLEEFHVLKLHFPVLVFGGGGGEGSNKPSGKQKLTSEILHCTHQCRFRLTPDCLVGQGCAE